jgi:hypothetical protein
MLVIRNIQMNRLKFAVKRRFRDRCLDRIRHDFPEQVAELGKPGAWDLIDFTVRTCKARGFDGDRSILEVLYFILDQNRYTPDSRGKAAEEGIFHLEVRALRDKLAAVDSTLNPS